jgi:hypothetical protein
MIAATGSSAYRHQRLDRNAPNLALSKHVLIRDMIRDMIRNELQDDKALQDGDRAKNRRLLRPHGAPHPINLPIFGSTKALSNGTGRPKTITPPMLTVL